MTTAELVERARRRLDWSPSAGPRIETFVPAALRNLSLHLGSHPTKRRYVFSDPSTTFIALDGAGSADLSALSDAGLLLDMLQYGEITDPGFPNMPLAPAGSTAEGALPGNFDAVFPHFWLVGTRILTRGAGGILAGPLSFACPEVKAIAAVRTQIHADLINEVVALAASASLTSPSAG